jgi:hypothetical protein
MERTRELDTDAHVVDPANRGLQQLELVELHPHRFVEPRALPELELAALT